MGVDTDHYLVCGYKFPYISFFDTDEDEDLWDEIREKMFLETDGMGGEWTVVGEKLAHADEYDGFPFISLDFEHYTLKKRMEIRDKVRKYFPDRVGVDELPQMLLFTQWS